VNWAQQTIKLLLIKGDLCLQVLLRQWGQ
jgi:hypothetical protein